MRLSAAFASALLGLPPARAILGLSGDLPGLVLDKTSRSGQFDHSELQKRSSRFSNHASAPFAVNGSALPNITFDVGESYAGLLPITDDANETKKLFFWFFPSHNPSSRNETVVWLNGGPGCTSMEGLVSGNGPINWLPGMSTPQPNPFTWLNLTNVVWIDQPLGVGYSQGDPNIEDEEQLAVQFVGFWTNFVQLFHLENWKTYLTGESYAGVYIPYIADAFISAGDTEYFNLAGIRINAAVMGDANLQMNIQLPAYVAHWNQVLGFNETFMADVQRRAHECGMTRYVREHLLFPPPAKPFRELLWRNDTWAELECDMFNAVLTAADLVNPCTNIYHITDTCPLLPSILGPTYANDTDHSSRPAWFSQPDVRAALHAPLEGSWARCTPSIFRNRSDNSLVYGDPFSQPPAATNLLSRVIEYTNNVIIGSGGLDMLVPTNGTLLVLQNVTWGGVQGFQRRPSRPFYSPYPPASNPAATSIAGLVGTWGRERGLTFYEVDLGGHELPRYAPGPSFRAMELLLGRIDSLDDVGEFTTAQNASSSEGCN